MLIIRTKFEENRKMVCVQIDDNGPGMEEVIRKRIFEPFFTTKPVGVGTGLGLSVSYFIITENHGGTKDVTSEPVKGASFIICLPAFGKKVKIIKDITHVSICSDNFLIKETWLFDRIIQYPRVTIVSILYGVSAKK